MVGVPSLKQAVTSCKLGVIELLLVVSNALYFRYRNPSNCESEAPLVKKVAAVPSGPTKLNGPSMLLLAAP